MQQSLRVGFLSSHNYLDRNAFSGILYYMYHALENKGLKLVKLGNPGGLSYWQKLLRKFRRESSLSFNSPSYLANIEKFNKTIQFQLEKNPCDVIFAPVGSEEIFLLETQIPIVYTSDTTFKLLQESYSWSHTDLALKLLQEQEMAAIQKSKRLVYSSEWAAYSAIHDYGANPERVRIVPFGANLDHFPSATDVSAHKQSSICRLLFIGRDWKRKGGETAFQTLLALIDRGVAAELVIVGCVPPDEIQHAKLTIIPVLNKNIHSQQQRLYDLLLNSNFFILPTQADCSPIVICEANAFGLPAITTNVGGIPTIVQNGKNGYMLSLKASGQEYAEIIAEVFSKSELYREMVRTSRAEFDNRLNWNKWADGLCAQFHAVLN